MPIKGTRFGPQIDRTGSTFGNLTVISLDNRPPVLGAYSWICLCKCGRTKSVLTNSLVRGCTTSCGCLAGRVDWTPTTNVDGSLGIPLTRGMFCKIDAIDLELIKRTCWAAQKKTNGYAARGKIDGKMVFMHRLIMNAQDGQQVDHRDGDQLNNRKDNLRICTAAQNVFNRGKFAQSGSVYKGLYVNKKRKNRKTWLVSIKVAGKRILLGTFHDEEAAARAYDDAAVQYHGEFARLNFPVA